jgi:hypothetical protein
MTRTANASVTVPGGATVSSSAEQITVVGASIRPTASVAPATDAGAVAAATSRHPAPIATRHDARRRGGAPGHDRAPYTTPPQRLPADRAAR